MRWRKTSVLALICAADELNKVEKVLKIVGDLKSIVESQVREDFLISLRNVLN